jgi:hypothetical protein
MLREGFNHGFAQSDWDAAKAEARQVMIECAQSRRMIPYSDLVRQITRIRLQAHDARLSHLLPKRMSEAGACSPWSSFTNLATCNRDRVSLNSRSLADATRPTSWSAGSTS